MDSTTKGTVATFTAFFLWGIFPLYWKALHDVSPNQIVAHRVVWSLVFLVFLLSIQRRWGEAKPVLSFANARIFLVTAFLLGTNWLLYLWAIQTEQIVEASLGYFINPLVNVVLGVAFLRERLFRWQKVSVVLALAGVLYLTLRYGKVPWIAFSLALTFGFYGLFRKTGRAESMIGLFSETAILTPLALIYLISLGMQGHGAFGSFGLKTDMLLAGAGAVTAVPLLLFGYGARRIQYATVGLLQYITPTFILLVGVLIYKEPFTSAHAIAFGFVWSAILIYSISSLKLYRKQLAS
jgi:chloramphenicol-sensitive protein RarD